jgi:palmitoyltransferase
VNLIQQNDNRKFLLWLDLFGSSQSADEHLLGTLDPRKEPDVPPDGEQVVGRSKGKGKQRAEQIVSEDIQHFTAQVLGSGEREINLRVESGNPQGAENETVDPIVNSLTTHPQSGGVPGDKLEPHQREHYHENPSWDSLPEAPFQDEVPATEMKLDEVVIVGDAVTAAKKLAQEKIERDKALRKELRAISTTLDDIPAVRPPESAGNHLQQAKDQLMARIEDNHDGQDGGDQDEFATSENADDADVRGSDVAANGSAPGDEDDDEQAELRTPGDQQRGLLTDIPLILGPPEIEALPMILQAGIVDDRVRGGDEDEIQGIRDAPDMHAVRCNILLAQESGRNLLRELLIFIAAWDLQDDDLYFKLMMQIMGAILNNGLMPFAYQAFSEEKDIVSPAQSMVIKILTQIFRSKSARSTASSDASLFLDPRPQREVPTRVDILVVRNMFTKFRQCVIPETCALIYLQGKIRTNAVAADGFPLTMWDMERVYEGVYQFLEFFAVLTETEEWKGLLVQWEIVNELVTLLRELEINIPKAPLGPLPQTVADAEAAAAVHAQSATIHQPTPTPVAVERPYDQAPTDSTWQRSEYADGGTSDTAEATMDSQDPSEFEWRNLKKLVVLVLSSLVWRSPTVQDQIRQYGGVEMILACCTLDGHNPYIREHAIMCLRFLLEDNEKNIDIVRQLAPRTTVPDEVMDKRGYETYIDDKGKVGLRAKEGAPASALHADDES